MTSADQRSPTNGNTQSSSYLPTRTLQKQQQGLWESNVCVKVLFDHWNLQVSSLYDISYWYKRASLSLLKKSVSDDPWGSSEKMGGRLKGTLLICPCLCMCRVMCLLCVHVQKAWRGGQISVSGGWESPNVGTWNRSIFLIPEENK